MEAINRFWGNVNKIPEGCWEWLGYCSLGGYGRFYFDGRQMPAHRFAYELLVGEVPEGLELDHLCRNRKCVNPDHLECVTRSENIKRGLLPSIGRLFQENKTHCPKGHPFNEENTYPRPDRPGRECRLCRLVANRRWLVNVRS